MEDFKIDFFKTEYGIDFPQFEHLSDIDSLMLRNRLFEIYGVSEISALVEDICLNQEYMYDINALENFKLLDTLENLKIHSLDKIFINWNRYDNIDLMSLSDLDTYFYDIWFPGPDDIDIFDYNLNWIVSINHAGVIKFLKEE